MRYQEVAIGLLSDSTRINPAFACVLRAVLVARRMLNKNDDRRARFLETFAKAAVMRMSNDVPGLVHGLAKALETVDSTMSIANGQDMTEQLSRKEQSANLVHMLS